MRSVEKGLGRVKGGGYLLVFMCACVGSFTSRTDRIKPHCLRKGLAENWRGCGVSAVFMIFLQTGHYFLAGKFKNFHGSIFFHIGKTLAIIGGWGQLFLRAYGRSDAGLAILSASVQDLWFGVYSNAIHVVGQPLARLLD